MKHVLVDGGPAYALKVPRDQEHQRSLVEFAELQERGMALIACQPVLTEVYSLTLYRHGTRAALSLLDTLRDSTAWIAPSVADSEEAASLLRRYPDQEISFVDAHLMVLSERLLMPIWTFDGHFDRLGANVWRA